MPKSFSREFGNDWSPRITKLTLSMECQGLLRREQRRPSRRGQSYNLLHWV